MKNLFNSVQLTRPNRNRFDLSCDVKFSTNFGNLTPVLVQECVPGDKFNIGCESIVRMAPMLAPVMHRMDCTIHYFFVPNRILWDNWEKFIVDPNTVIVPPYITYSDPAGYSAAAKRLIDYLGVPPPPIGSTEEVLLNALPLAAFQCIYNEYYRDENLIPEVNYKLNNGSNTANGDLYTPRQRAWMHDYFTAALPWAQKGAAVDIPLGTVEDSPVRINRPFPGSTTLDGTPVDATVTYKSSSAVGADELYTEGADIEPTTINTLRRAFRLQEFLERMARGGTRYIESILANFGVKSSDARLQRPEYIVGVKTPIVVSEVLNTTGIDGELPQGNMAGHGISVNSSRHGYYNCEEHGYIIGIMSVMPMSAYQQGIPKTYLRKDPLDWYWPTFANIGEQPVQVQELYAYTANKDNTFGYVPRYSEYKYNPSRVAGEFRTSLDYWHLGRKFATEPTLSKEFIECTPAETQRIFAVTDPNVDKLYCHIYHRINAIRPMPKFGTPII